MEERIQKRIAELERAEQELRVQIGAVITVIAELRALIAPDAPPDHAAELGTISGSPLGEQDA